MGRKRLADLAHGDEAKLGVGEGVQAEETLRRLGIRLDAVG
jgi:hypothetical protein